MRKLVSHCDCQDNYQEASSGKVSQGAISYCCCDAVSFTHEVILRCLYLIAAKTKSVDKVSGDGDTFSPLFSSFILVNFILQKNIRGKSR